MKLLFRWAFRVFLVLVVLTVALVLLKDVLLKAFAEHQIRSQTGMDVKIGRFELGLFTPTLAIEGCQLYNPAQFGGSPFMNIPDLYLQCDPAAFAQGRLRFRLVRLAVAEMNIVEGRNGQTNLLQAAEGLQRAVRAPRLASLFGIEFAGVDTLNLSLGTVRFTTLRQPGKPTEVKLDLKNEILTNVCSMADLTNVVMTRLFRNGITITSQTPGPRSTLALEARKPSSSTTARQTTGRPKTGPKTAGK